MIWTFWWGKCFCRLCTGTGVAYACSLRMKPDHLVSCFLITAMRQDVPLIATMRDVPPCGSAWFDSHLHNCGHWCCTDMVLKGCTTWNAAVLSPNSTNSILENRNLSDRQAAFIFYWYSSMNPFVMVGNPCLGFAEAFWHCIGGISLHSWVLISCSYTGINYPGRGKISFMLPSNYTPNFQPLSSCWLFDIPKVPGPWAPVKHEHWQKGINSSPTTQGLLPAVVMQVAMKRSWITRQEMSKAGRQQVHIRSCAQALPFHPGDHQ